MSKNVAIAATENHLTSDPTNDRSQWKLFTTFHRANPSARSNGQKAEFAEATGQNERPSRQLARFLRPFQQSPLKQDTIVVLQRWEGNVLTADKEVFVARVRDLTAGGTDEEIEVSLDEISLADREMVVPGASFYWTIGYRDMRNGQRLRISEFRFRRLRTLSQSELTDAKTRARRLEELLGW